jgi:hypothetical protein
MQIFEAKTGKFTPLPADQLAKLTTDQRNAYNALVLAVDELDAANAEATDARDSNQAAVRRLDAAEAADKKRPKWTFLDEWKANLRVSSNPVGVVPEQQPSDTQDAQKALAESHIWLRSAAERQGNARGAVALCVQKWQVASGVTQTQEQQRREFIESENRLRAERVASGQPRPSSSRPGPSAIDQHAYYTRGARGRQVGPGGAPLYGYRRGGQNPNAELGRRQAVANAAARAAKLPSER